MEAIKSLKESKRTRKSAITKALNDLAVPLAVKEQDCTHISASLEHIEEKKEEALAIMRDLEIEYEKLKKTADAEKTSDEADALVDRVDNDTNTARSYLAAQAKIFSSKQKESSEIEGQTNAQQGASDGVAKTRVKGKGQGSRVRVKGKGHFERREIISFAQDFLSVITIFLFNAKLFGPTKT